MIEPVQAVPAPAGAPAGAIYFRCTRLSAVLSTSACAGRWNTAPSASTCCGCPIGRQHQHELAEPDTERVGPQVRERQRECMRCGRTDLRVIQAHSICVSCFNRSREWRVGQNSKGVPPVHFEPLRMFAVTTQTAAGDIVHHAVEARHRAEATGVVAMRLPSGARLSPARPGQSTWSRSHRKMVVACPRCSRAGLLEREWRGTLRHCCPRCNGAPSDPAAWSLARPRAPTTVWPAATLVTWLRATSEPLPAQWRRTEVACANCRVDMLQARTTRAGAVEARCPACGDAHEH